MLATLRIDETSETTDKHIMVHLMVTVTLSQPFPWILLPTVTCIVAILFYLWEMLSAGECEIKAAQVNSTRRRDFTGGFMDFENTKGSLHIGRKKHCIWRKCDCFMGRLKTGVLLFYLIHISKHKKIKNRSEIRRFIEKRKK